MDELAGGPVLNEGFARDLVDRAPAEGVNLVGPGGLLGGLTKRVLETALEAEMSEHLGYDANDPIGRNGENSRNGVRTDVVSIVAVLSLLREHQHRLFGVTNERSEGLLVEMRHLAFRRRSHVLRPRVGAGGSCYSRTALRRRSGWGDRPIVVFRCLKPLSNQSQRWGSRAYPAVTQLLSTGVGPV